MSGNPAADYSEGASHVLAVIHQILGHHRALEARWHARKVKLHQRLALRYTESLCIIFSGLFGSFYYLLISRINYQTLRFLRLQIISRRREASFGLVD